jgi:hypothetical protein
MQIFAIFFYQSVGVFWEQTLINAKPRNVEYPYLSAVNMPRKRQINAVVHVAIKELRSVSEQHFERIWVLLFYLFDHVG